MAEVSIDIAKETSVAAVKTDTAAIKADVTTIKSDVSTVKTNVAGVKSKTDLIGSATDTGGSATAGTVMGKLNKLIGGSGGLMKATSTAKKTVTTGLVSGLSMAANGTSGSVSTGKTYSSRANVMQGIYAPKAGRITIKAAYTAESIEVSGEETLNSYGVRLGIQDESDLKNYETAVGTVSTGTGTFIASGKVEAGTTAGTVSLTALLPSAGLYNLYLRVERYKSETSVCSVSGFALTKVEFCYGDNEDIVNL